MARAKPVTTSAAASPGKCPICSRATVTDYRPFCSRRCADVDLGRWLKESYRVPTDETPDDGDDPSREPTGQGR